MPRLGTNLKLENALMLGKAYLADREIKKAETSFSSFIKLAWPVIEPGTKYVHGWHIDAIADHLEAVSKGQIRKLIINVPPRSSKSSIGAVMFPAWWWINNAHKKLLFCSYDLKLATRDSRKTRTLIKSPWYQKHWADRYSIVKDQDEKGRFDNNKMGFRMAFSVDAGTTGEGGDCLDGSVRVMTDRGEIPIREIVENRLPVKVLGSSGKFRDIEHYGWREGEELIEIEAADGTRLPCTGGHPLFVESMGYVPVRDVITYKYASIQLRRLPSSIRKAAEARSPFHALILFQDLLREVLYRISKPSLRWGNGSKKLLDLWRRILVQARGGRSSDTLRCLHSGGQDGLVATMRNMLKDIPNSIQASNLLFDGMCSSRQIGSGEWALCSREEDSVWNRVQRGIKAQDLRAGQLAMRGMRCQEGTTISAVGCSPFGRGQEEPSSDQFGISLQAVSSEDSSKERAQPRIDEAVGIVAVRRLPAPDVVYNLQVAVDNDYYANGILTHNCVYYDDLNDVKKMTSDAYMESVIRYHEDVMVSRLNDTKNGVRVNVQQRCGQNDITGHILEKEYGWDLLIIPNEYEGPSKVTSIGWKDPRTKVGELFCPDRITPEYTEEVKSKPVRYAGQYQQRPAPSEGATYKREWFRYYNEPGETTKAVKIETQPGKYIEREPITLPVAFEQLTWGIDCAFKDGKENDLTAIHVWGRVGSNVFLLHRRTGRWDFPRLQREIREVNVDFNCPEKMIENKANGPAIIQSLKNEISGMIESPIDGGLIALAGSLTGYAEAGNVYFPNPDLHPWVRELIEQYAMFPNGKHDDDIAAASHAQRRLFDAASNSGVPEFRVVPRIGEPENASHVKPDSEIAAEIEPIWRRWIAISPGQLGAALWICETPTKALRVYRELSLDGIDAHEAGRQIAEMSMPDVTAFMKLMNARAKWNIQFLMEKAAFEPVEPIGSYAELLEDGILSYESTSDSWIERQETKEKMKLAKFTSEMTEIEDGSIDRLRDLLRFSPPDFKQVPYDRRKAIALADKDAYQYNSYISAVEGKVFGEWPKIKIAASCKGVIRALGGFRRTEDATDHFLRALLIGASAPANALMTQKVPQDAPYPFAAPQGNGRSRMARRFGRRVA